MPTEVLVKYGTPITWENGGTPAMNLDSLATVAARQGAKHDLTATHADEYLVEVMIDTGGTAPAVGATIDVYLSRSNSGTAGTGNEGGASGTDAAYTGIGSATILESIVQCLFVGSVVCVDEVDTNLIQFFRVSPGARYVSPIVYNATLQTLGAASYVKMTPIIPESQ